VVQALPPAPTEDAADAQGSRPAMDAVIKLPAALINSPFSAMNCPLW